MTRFSTAAARAEHYFNLSIDRITTIDIGTLEEDPFDDWPSLLRRGRLYKFEYITSDALKRRRFDLVRTYTNMTFMKCTEEATDCILSFAAENSEVLHFSVYNVFDLVFQEKALAAVAGEPAAKVSELGGNAGDAAADVGEAIWGALF
jgi:hypothetical protein